MFDSFFPKKGEKTEVTPEFGLKIENYVNNFVQDNQQSINGNANCQHQEQFE